MEKKKLSGTPLKEQYRARARDRLHNFLLAGGAVRGAILNGTCMMNEMRANHELGILETLVLGRAYLGIALMAAGLKGNDRIAMQITCSGPIKGLSVEANAYGEVRGYLKRVPIPIDRPLEDFSLSRFFGAGILSVTKTLQDAKQPFTGQVELRYGNIAQDLAHYCMTSEQIPTAFNLSIKFNPEGEVTGAGGLFLQAMPHAAESLTTELEDRVLHFPSLGEAIAMGKDPVELVTSVFGNHSPKMLSTLRVEFMCHCNRERLINLLTMLPIHDLKDLRDNGPFPTEIRCHNCNTPYTFSREEIEAIYGSRYPHN
jgi:molecular chaperone Hsp33